MSVVGVECVFGFLQCREEPFVEEGGFDFWGFWSVGCLGECCINE